jgi:hypothetical protein
VYLVVSICGAKVGSEFPKPIAKQLPELHHTTEFHKMSMEEADENVTCQAAISPRPNGNNTSPARNIELIRHLAKVQNLTTETLSHGVFSLFFSESPCLYYLRQGTVVQKVCLRTALLLMQEVYSKDRRVIQKWGFSVMEQTEASLYLRPSRDQGQSCDIL